MTLSVRVGVIIGGLSIIISTIVAGASYYYQLLKATEQSQQLVAQLAQSAKRTSAIAAYLDDQELAGEIVAGLSNNDLIAGAVINVPSTEFSVQTGILNPNVQSIEVTLYDPFSEEVELGILKVFPDIKFIQARASSSSLQDALLLMLLSVLIAVCVWLYVRNKLTRPLRALSTKFSSIDTTAPDQMQAIDISYTKNDEIGYLVTKINALILALQKQFRSERQLRQTTEELQKRYRLLFEQATAGIAVLSQEGTVSIANPAFNQLFGENTEGKDLADFFHSASEFKSQLETLYQDDVYPHIEVELISYLDSQKRYLHCLFSTIKEERDKPRNQSEHLTEVMIYDVTKRKEQEYKVRYEADHDSLTNLLNRRSGTLKLKQQMTSMAGSEKIFALMMMDLDKFKPINDNYGHDVGDLVLTTISERLSQVSADFDISAIRWGGDEFLIGVSADSPKIIEDYAALVLKTVQQPITINQNLSVAVGASIGIITLTALQTETVGIEDLINKSDALMYDVKQTSKNSFTIVAYQN
jgi:diguanylate cyclase (GGDEF)-like protein/PAS domain S-box-containing protein